MESFFMISNDSLRDMQTSGINTTNNTETNNSIIASTKESDLTVEMTDPKSLKRRKTNNDGEFINI